jgi:hypothetical protein
MRNLTKLALLGWATILLYCAGSPAMAQPAGGETPCGIALHNQSAKTSGLVSVDGGAIVYDSNQGLCWLADANLAGHADVRAEVTLSPVNLDGSAPVINPDGTMDYWTAVNWVNALNSYNGGRGWLNRNNWQLPTNPAVDTTCSSSNVDNFGIQCTGSAMGNLYNVGLAEVYPASVVPRFLSIVWPLFNLQPGLYWTSDSNGSGEVTFSFNTGINGSNTTKYNFFHVLPMTRTVLGPVLPGGGVVPYLFGPAAGRAVYDTISGNSWTLDANLPAAENFGFTQTTTITEEVNGNMVTVPLVDQDGAVHFSAIDPANTASGWIVSMNDSEYAGTQNWKLPCLNDLVQLYNDLGLNAGDARLEWQFFVGPFWRLQPGFYWGCSRADNTGPSGPCEYAQSAPQGLYWSFNFEDGFEGTDLQSKQFYVMVYFPAP